MNFVASIAEQGFGSILTFAINLWMIRNGASDSYGVYVFWYAVAWVLGSVQGTLVIAHLFGLPSARTHAAERRDPERLFLSVTLGLLVLCGLFVAGLDAILAARHSQLTSAAAVLFIPAFLLFQFARALCFSRQRPIVAAGLTGVILLASGLALGADFVLVGAPNAARVLTITGLCYGLCSAVVIRGLMGTARPMVRRAEIRRYAHLLRGSFWLMLGAGSGEVVSRLYGFAVVGRFGAEALAGLSAVQVVVRPAWLLSAAWSQIGFPQMSARRAEGNHAGIVRIMLSGGALTALGSLVWAGLVIAGWPWISGVLYHGRYGDLGVLGYLWGGNVMLGSIAVALNTAMLALGEYRRLALLDLAGAFVTIGAVYVVVSRFAYPWAVGATMLGQFTQIALMAAVLLVRLRQPAPLAA